MATMELARYRIDPATVAEMQDRWHAAVQAIRARFPGLITAQLTQLDDDTFVDVWQWETREAALAAADGAPQIPEAAALFALIVEPPTMEHGEIVQQNGGALLHG
jgi:heme-degrading monooxygenase HmoA